MATSNNQVIIVGAGHNGLIVAFYLAKAGLRPLVLERRHIIGGSAVTEELHPGFRCPTVQHSLGPMIPKVVADLQLEKNGLGMITPDVRVFAPRLEGPPVCLYQDASRTARALETISSHDAKAYPKFLSSFAAIGKVLEPVMSMTPPSINEPAKESLWELAKLGMKFRGLSKKDAFRLLRWVPMAVADLAAEWFETETLRAIIAARGVYCSLAGPWSAGTSSGLLMQAALNGNAIAPSLFVKGGIGSLTQSIATSATAAGAQIRTGVHVKSIQVDGGKVSGVVLSNGEEIAATTVISNADPRSTYLNLLDPVELDPDFRMGIHNYRCMGSSAKVNLALSDLPEFIGTKSDRAIMAGRIHIGPEIDYLEQAYDAAKYGAPSPHPFLDITIPSLTDPSLAPQGGHVMSIHVQYTPFKLKSGDWNLHRKALGETVIKTLSEYAPNVNGLIIAQQVLTPLDLEEQFGLSGGHILHGEPSLDQLFAFRPLHGWAQYRSPIKGLYLCGSGTHPGGGVTGAPGFNAGREILKDLKA